MLNESFQYKDHFISLMLEDKADERLAVLLKHVSNMQALIQKLYFA